MTTCRQPTDAANRRGQRRGRWFACAPAGLLGVGLLLAGCATDQPMDLVLGGGYTPANAYRSVDRLPDRIRRVALLPLTSAATGQLGETARESLQPVLLSELTKLSLFEVVVVPPEQVKAWTGKTAWAAEDKLPPDFFQRMRESLNCDGVLFARLSEYRPYPPLAIGWNLKLTESETGKILWSVDEVFDAGNPKVENSARRYYQGQIQDQRPLADSKSILTTPRRFAQYTANAALSTIPMREISPKVSGKPADK